MLNRFSYVGGNVLRYVDPTGLCSGDPNDPDNPDADCWALLYELESYWEIDIQDSDLWELAYLEHLSRVLNNAAAFLGGDYELRSVLASSASDGFIDRFVFRGTVADWTHCSPVACAAPGQIRIELATAFGSNPGAWHDLGKKNAYRNQPLSGQLTMAHELAHIIADQVPGYKSSYLQLREFEAIPYYYGVVWVNEDSNSPTLYAGDPIHHLIHLTALYVSAGNTWNLVKQAETRASGGRVPLGDQQYIEFHNFWRTSSQRGR